MDGGAGIVQWAGAYGSKARLSIVRVQAFPDGRTGQMRRRQCFSRLGDADFAEMEDGRRQHRAGMALCAPHPPDPATLPTPPEAITGTATASATARVEVRS